MKVIVLFYPDVNGVKQIYIDECGNFGYDFTNDGTSSHFIITAIIIDEANVEVLKAGIDEIRDKYFPNGEIKSSKIAKNHSRRFKILQDVLKYDFKVISLIVDKEKIYFETSGLKFKQTFVKYLNKLLYKDLKLIYPHLHIHADTHGSEKFMSQFSNYVEKTDSISFFDSFQFEFLNSTNETLIQLADFIGGTLSFGYEKKKICTEYRGFYELLSPRIILLRHWPVNFENYQKNLEVLPPSEYDKNIANYCIRSATKHIKENEDSEDKFDTDRLRVLYHLLNQIYAFNPSKYIYASELIKLLNTSQTEKYDNHSFMTLIIAKLRDEGVIIASSSNGYKIPLSQKELFSYTNKTLGQVIPMLERLKKARERVLVVTNNELDILDQPEYEKIKKYFIEN